MPFDEQIPERNGGGGGDDPEQVRQIVQATLMMVRVNIELNGVCPLHTRLDVMLAMASELMVNIRLCKKDPSYTGNFDEMAAQGLRKLASHILESLEELEKNV